MVERPRFDVPDGKAAQVSIIDSSLRLNSNWDGHVLQNVADILVENNMQPSKIDSVIWCHHHFDHIGDITTFPGSAELIVGPGFKKAFLPGYPADPDSPVCEADFEGRDLREIDFEHKPLQIGQFRAVDFFGDGSFYLLASPDHDIGHLAGLTRTTTAPDTFIFMGGDLCHHGGELRPSQYLPYPSNLSEHTSLSDSLSLHLSQCPGSAFDNTNVERGRAAGETFFDSAIEFDKELAIKTIREAQTADAQDNVFFVFAHDTTTSGIIDLFPKQANDWKKKGWKGKTFWKFLNDFKAALEP